MEEVEIIITEIIWDEWNVAHISRHNITPDEVEQTLSNSNVVFLKAKQGRLMVLGRAGARLITTILNAQKMDGAFYVITARDMSKKERTFYRKRVETRNE